VDPTGCTTRTAGCRSNCSASHRTGQRTAYGTPLGLAAWSWRAAGGGEVEKVVADVCLGLPRAVVPDRAGQVIAAVEQVAERYTAEPGDSS